MRISLIIAAVFLFAGGIQADTPALLAHYMPWFTSEPYRGTWGGHWTMHGARNPNKIRENGQREIAAHQYPLIGPYDSADPHLLEYHVLLMKLSGIDGVIVDWYGIKQHSDYLELHQNTQALIPWLEKAGLKFVLCYEDQSIKHMVKAGVLTKGESVDHAREVMQWVDRQWFNREVYFNINHRPLLMVFGPQYFNRSQWNHVLGGLEKRPILYGLPHLHESGGTDASFGWPPVIEGREISREEWMAYLDQLYTGENPIGLAFPGFHDYYEQAGQRKSFGHIPHREGKTFIESFDRAENAHAQIIQLVTWNDYGEGTVIEPTAEFGYRYLEEVQRRSKSKFTSAELRSPARLYQLRKAGSTRKKEATSLAARLFARP